MTKQEFIKAFKTIEGQANPLQKFITKVGIIEMIDKSTEENVENIFNTLLESITTTGVVKYENGEITIGVATESETESTDEPIVEEPTVEEPIVEEPIVEEPTVEEPIVESNPDVPTTELPETEQ